MIQSSVTFKVTFVGEDAIDTGGPRREFWQLLMEKAQQQYCIGRDGMMTFTQNTSALQVNLLYNNICSHR